MIVSFGDKATEDIYNGFKSKAARRIPQDIWKTANRKLDMINASKELNDLKAPPANKLEKLKGKWIGYYSIRINDQYRIVFKWNNQNADKVLIIDYH
ncbi:MAG: plasmid maintenance system killer protein [Ignavibacteriae bacterium]|nr:MAG: plasmid maintenance system killer protein [Ignavibacteriota bacterium]